MRRQARKWIIFGSLIAILIGVVIRGFFFETFRVATPAMEPNLLVGDLIIVSKLSYDFHLPGPAWSFLGLPSPKVGEVVLYGEGVDLSVGRIAATPGSRVYLEDYEIRELVAESPPELAQTPPLTVPAGYYLILPDEKWVIDSLDSFLVERSRIIGKLSRIWLSLNWEEQNTLPKVRWNRFFSSVN